MKTIFVSLLALACTLAARAQVHDHHDGHSHADETPGALIRDAADAIALQPGERVLHSFTTVAPRFGVAVQKGLFAEAGVSLDICRIGYTAGSEYVSFGYSNLRPYVAGEIMLSDKLLGGGKAGIEYIRSTPLVGMALGAEGSYYTDGNGDAVVFTPRLVLSLVKVELHYGYNIFVCNELRPWIGRHRLGVTMTLDPRFWRRKRKACDDYYNTY